ncbi:hypothetical protein KC711_07225 [Candidatus Peregrinibacteria bacterium]|nr:hypothetical protein [Candidatus Peregrinibacteria bacterium]
MIIVTKIFAKSLKTFDIQIVQEIRSLLSKHKRGLENNLFEIKEYQDIIILK